MVGKSNILPRGTGKKQWEKKAWYKTTFDIPMKRMKRKLKRRNKAAKIFPRPVSKLYPVVRCCQSRFNMKLKKGKGFSFDEVKEAGMKIQYARRIGISVDSRRKNRNEEEFQRNVSLLKDYTQRLVPIPRDPKKEIKGMTLKSFLGDKNNQMLKQKISQEFDKNIPETRTITEKDFKKKGANKKMLSEYRRAAKQSYDIKKAKIEEAIGAKGKKKGGKKKDKKGGKKKAKKKIM